MTSFPTEVTAREGMRKPRSQTNRRPVTASIIQGPTALSGIGQMQSLCSTPLAGPAIHGTALKYS